MRVIAFIEDPDVIKKILKHLDLWDVKRKPLPTANVYPPWRTPPIDVFPVYDEQPGPSTDDYTCPPSEDQGSGLVRLRRIALQKPIFTKSRRSW